MGRAQSRMNTTAAVCEYIDSERVRSMAGGSVWVGCGGQGESARMYPASGWTSRHGRRVRAHLAPFLRVPCTRSVRAGAILAILAEAAGVRGERACSSAGMDAGRGKAVSRTSSGGAPIIESLRKGGWRVLGGAKQEP